MDFVLKQYDTALLSFDPRLEGPDGFVCTSSEILRCRINRLCAGENLTGPGLQICCQRSVRSFRFMDRPVSDLEPAVLKKICGNLNIKNKDDALPIRLNEERFFSPGFKDLWGRIKYETTHSRFDDLVNKEMGIDH